MSGTLDLSAAAENWPIRGEFTIARGSKSEAAVVVAEIRFKDHRGRGECVPYGRYGESLDCVVAAIDSLRGKLEGDFGRAQLASLLPPGAARNAIDSALFDLEAKRAGCPAFELAGLQSLEPVPTAFTISLGDPETMATEAKKAKDHPLLKLKLGGRGDSERLAAIRAAVPKARLIVDANEAWHPGNIEQLLEEAARARVELVEQPLPAGEDDMLAHISHLVPICADEAAHDTASLERAARLYDAVNIKLDKTGGLTEALAMSVEARARGLKIMVGCMVATSLAMAPALILAQGADWVDLDGPLLLSADREHGLTYKNGLVFPSSPALWG